MHHCTASSLCICIHVPINLCDVHVEVSSGISQHGLRYSTRVGRWKGEGGRARTKAKQMQVVLQRLGSACFVLPLFMLHNACLPLVDLHRLAKQRYHSLTLPFPPSYALLTRRWIPVSRQGMIPDLSVHADHSFPLFTARSNTNPLNTVLAPLCHRSNRDLT